MARIERRLATLGLVLPPPPGVVLPFNFVRIVGSRALGDLDRVTAWTRVFGMVASAPGFDKQPAEIEGEAEFEA